MRNTTLYLNESEMHSLVRQIILETVDELDLYHGTKADFDKFDLAYMSSGAGMQVYGKGVYLSTSFDTAKDYAGGGQVMKCQVPNGPYLSDKSVSQAVKQRIANSFFKYYTEEDEYGKDAYGSCKDEFWKYECSSILNANTGVTLYNDIAAITGDEKIAAGFLRKLGFIGLKIKSDGDKFYNYTIFDPDDIEIIEKIPVE